MTQYCLNSFKLINKKTGEILTDKMIVELAKEKGFFENEFKTSTVMLKENGTPVIFGFHPLTSFSLNRDEWLLEWGYY